MPFPSRAGEPSSASGSHVIACHYWLTPQEEYHAICCLTNGHGYIPIKDPAVVSLLISFNLRAMKILLWRCPEMEWLGCFYRRVRSPAAALVVVAFAAHIPDTHYLGDG